MLKVLYTSYDGTLEPLGKSQIIPYLKELSKYNIKYILLSYEKKSYLKKKEDINELKKFLKSNNIKWKGLRYHKSPTLPATLFDISIGILYGIWCILFEKIKIVHSRSYVTALIALFLKKIFNVKFIFDMRGLWVDERVDGNLWKKESKLYKIGKIFEKFYLLNADEIVTLTQKSKEVIKNFPYMKDNNTPITVIPTCTDLEIFHTDKSGNIPDKFKQKLQNRFVVTYIGSLGTWYMINEMIDFFKVLKQKKENSCFLILTKDDPNELINILNKKNIDPQDYIINFVPYNQVPEWLKYTDIGIFFCKICFSKIGSCATKMGEYLACGVPVIFSTGIGDSDDIIKDNNVGYIINDFTQEEYEKALLNIINLIENDKDLKKRCYNLAYNYFNLQLGVKKYLEIYKRLGLNYF